MKFTTLKKVGKNAATVVGAVVVTAVVVSGTLSVAQAATETVPNNSVTSAKILNNSVQGIDIKDSSVAAADLAISIRPRYAHIAASSAGASIINARGVVSASRLATGQFLVDFNAPITNCGWFATLTDNDAGSSVPGEISIERNSAGDPDTLRVRTYNSAGTLVDPSSTDGFSVRVDCATA
jgi:hypothetical protein